MATKTIATLKITNPAGESRTIALKPSVSIAIEERLGRPIWSQVFEGYSYTVERVAFEVGRDAGFIPPEVTFEQFVDADPGWEVDIVRAGVDVPRELDADADPEAPGEA